MREIKFRAWDKSGIFNGTIPCMHNDITGLTIFDSIWHDDYFPKMQYTGLKDKNGKEIYEGDIVKSVDEDSKPQIYTIVWSETRACFDMKLGYSARIFFPLSHAMEVIGNIYENPDLLK